MFSIIIYNAYLEDPCKKHVPLLDFLKFLKFCRIINVCKQVIFCSFASSKEWTVVFGPRGSAPECYDKTQSVWVVNEPAAPFHVHLFGFFLRSLTHYVLVKRGKCLSLLFLLLRGWVQEGVHESWHLQRENLRCYHVRQASSSASRKGKKSHLACKQSEKCWGEEPTRRWGNEMIYLALISIGNALLMAKLSLFVRPHGIDVYQSSLQVCWLTFCHIWCLLVWHCDTLNMCSCPLVETGLYSHTCERF